MTKLYGQADAVLVSAAFREGQSNVALDLSDVYTKREQTMKEFATNVQGLFDKIYADDKKTWDLLADNAQKSLDILENGGGETSDYDLDMHQDVVNNYKTRLREINSQYGKGKGGDGER